MKLKVFQWLASIAMLAFASCAQATVVCNFSSNPGVSAAYVPSHATQTITSTTFAVTCTDTNGPGLVTVTYSVAANNGINFTGTQNRGAFGGSFFNYSLAQDPACATPWKGTTYFNATFSMAKNTSVTNTYTYYSCLPVGQNPPTGTYTDTVTTSFAVGTVSTGGKTFTPGTFPVSIFTPASCSITTPPSNVAFTYTAFNAAAVLANASIGMTCTTSLTYTMALDATVDVVTGLNYTLALNTTANTGGVSPLASVGTGVLQTFFINGSMAAGQAGTCATPTCTGSQVRTLTITY